MAKERIQKILAKAGLCSRRQAEIWIEEGLITVNGRVAGIGDQADSSRDAIKVRGKLLKKDPAQTPVYYAFHKPRGVISMLTADSQRRPTLLGYAKKIRSKVFPIGRMEFNTEGLLLLTNDGDLADRIVKEPQIVRVYEVKVRGTPTELELERLKRGTRFEGREIRPLAVRLKHEYNKKSLIEICVGGEGKLQLGMLFQRKGFLVERIRRIAIGHVKLGELQPGAWRALKKSQLEALVNQPELGYHANDLEVPSAT